MAAPTESSPDARAAEGRVPDFFILGHYKCGTTALYEMLSRHPEVHMSPVKEPRYLAEDMRSRFPSARGHRLPETFAEYLQLFRDAQPGQRVGEASPCYLTSHTAAARIAEVQPAARVIAILREPASFLRSLHLQLLRSHVETEQDLRRALELEPSRREGRNVPRRSHLPQLLQYSEHVRYVAQLRRYHDVLPAEQVQVVIYDDFLADNRAVLTQTMRFIGVDETYPLEEIHVKKTTRTMHNQRLDDALLTVTLGRSPAARAARATVKALMPRRARHGAFVALRRDWALRPPPPPDPRLMDELRARYKPEVVALSEYLDLDLVARWGYDRLT